MKKLILLTALLVISGLSYGEVTMTQAIMEKIVKSISQNSRGEKGAVEFFYKDVRMYLISDVVHDRMRIVAPVTEYKKLTDEHVDAVLISNYHSALEARYAVSKGLLHSVYIHPMSDLSEKQLKSAVQQVANLAITFGSKYTSGVLSFAGGQ